MNPREPDGDEPDRLSAHLARVTPRVWRAPACLSRGEPSSVRGSVVGSGRSRALAGMTATAPEEAAVKRWMVRLGGLESEASPEALEQGAREAIALMGALREAQAVDDAEPLLDCIESIALERVRLTKKATDGLAFAGPPAPAPGYQDLMATARLRDVACHRVEKLRRDLFGSARVPFATMAEAVAWVEAEHEAAGEYTREEESAFLEAYRKIDVQLLQLQYQGSPYDDDYSLSAGALCRAARRRCGAPLSGGQVSAAAESLPRPARPGRRPAHQRVGGRLLRLAGRAAGRAALQHHRP